MIRNGLKRLFNPTTIAVIGASNKKEHTGYAIMKNLIYDGFQGRIYPVNPNAESVFGSKSYKSIDDVPEQVDLAVIALPAAMVPDVLESCGKKNIHSAIIISSGFKESGTNGETLFDKIGQIAKTHDITVLGPNCLGFIRPTKSLNITFANKTARPGGIAFISTRCQFGILCDAPDDFTTTVLLTGQSNNMSDSATLCQSERCLTSVFMTSSIISEAIRRPAAFFFTWNRWIMHENF